MTGPITLTAPPAPTTTQPGTTPSGTSRSPTTQTAPRVMAPLVITAPPAPSPVPPSDRFDQEPRLHRDDPADDNRRRLGEPIFVQPGTAPYVAPQYSTGTPAYASPSYGPGSGRMTAGRACQRTAPAFDESGRFLATVCIR
jgi:hypothetical protein